MFGITKRHGKYTEGCNYSIPIHKREWVESSASYPFVVDLWMFNLYPTRPHNLSLENQRLKGSRVSAKYLRDVLSGHREDGSIKNIGNVNTERKRADHGSHWHKPPLTIGSLLLVSLSREA